MKRWVILLLGAVLVLGFGWGLFLFWVFLNSGTLERGNVIFDSDAPTIWAVMIITFLSGIAIALMAINKLSHPDLDANVFLASTDDISRTIKSPVSDLRIVAIGGGTGMPGLLRSLVPYTDNITAIVTVADDGGSSGRLRKELRLLPPGDFRNNLAALAHDERLMTQVLQYRFGGLAEHNGQNELKGHAFGNLLLAALTGITGSFDEALLAAQEVLALRGQVLPSTLSNITLVADVADMLLDGSVQEIAGESAITSAMGRIERVRLEPEDVRAFPPALRAIFQADLILIGPGSLYTSILPNLLITDLCEALIHARGKVVYICNLATQPGETDKYTVVDHVDAIMRHTPPGLFDLVLANSNLSIPPETGGGTTHFVEPIPPPEIETKLCDLVDEARPWRHDSTKLGRAVMDILLH
jgi:uncharacterized cofD-like protein